MQRVNTALPVGWEQFAPLAPIQAFPETEGVISHRTLAARGFPAHIQQMSLLDQLRTMIDREWIRTNWCGSQTLRHRLIAFSPGLRGSTLASLPLPRWLQTLLVVPGFMGFLAVIMWIEVRRMTGTGAFSTRRSKQFVRRNRLRRQKSGGSG